MSEFGPGWLREELPQPLAVVWHHATLNGADGVAISIALEVALRWMTALQWQSRFDPTSPWPEILTGKFLNPTLGSWLKLLEQLAERRSACGLPEALVAWPPPATLKSLRTVHEARNRLSHDEMTATQRERMATALAREVGRIFADLPLRGCQLLVFLEQAPQGDDVFTGRVQVFRGADGAPAPEWRRWRGVVHVNEPYLWVEGRAWPLGPLVASGERSPFALWTGIGSRGEAALADVLGGWGDDNTRQSRWVPLPEHPMTPAPLIWLPRAPGADEGTVPSAQAPLVVRGDEQATLIERVRRVAARLGPRGGGGLPMGLGAAARGRESRQVHEITTKYDVSPQRPEALIDVATRPDTQPETRPRGSSAWRWGVAAGLALLLGVIALLAMRGDGGEPSRRATSGAATLGGADASGGPERVNGGPRGANGNVEGMAGEARGTDGAAVIAGLATTGENSPPVIGAGLPGTGGRDAGESPVGFLEQDGGGVAALDSDTKQESDRWRPIPGAGDPSDGLDAQGGEAPDFITADTDELTRWLMDQLEQEQDAGARCSATREAWRGAWRLTSEVWGARAPTRARWQGAIGDYQLTWEAGDGCRLTGVLKKRGYQEEGRPWVWWEQAAAVVGEIRNDSVVFGASLGDGVEANTVTMAGRVVLREGGVVGLWSYVGASKARHGYWGIFRGGRDDGPEVGLSAEEVGCLRGCWRGREPVASEEAGACLLRCRAR